MSFLYCFLCYFVVFFSPYFSYCFDYYIFLLTPPLWFFAFSFLIFVDIEVLWFFSFQSVLSFSIYLLSFPFVVYLLTAVSVFISRCTHFFQIFSFSLTVYPFFCFILFLYHFCNLFLNLFLSRFTITPLCVLCFGFPVFFVFSLLSLFSV